MEKTENKDYENLKDAYETVKAAYEDLKVQYESQSIVVNSLERDLSTYRKAYATELRKNLNALNTKSYKKEDEK